MPPKIDDNPKRLNVMISADTMQQLDDWRRRQPVVPNLSEAVRTLLELGIETAAKKGDRGRCEAEALISRRPASAASYLDTGSLRMKRGATV